MEMKQRLFTIVVELYRSRETANPYSYCVKENGIAVTYYIPEIDIVVSLKADFKHLFKRFPKMVEYIDSKEFCLKEMRKLPFSLLVKLDTILSKKQNRTEKRRNVFISTLSDLTSKTQRFWNRRYLW